MPSQRTSNSTKGTMTTAQRRVPEKVESEEQLIEWWDAVQSDDDLEPGARYLLLQLSSPAMMDREVWRVTWSLPRMIEASGRSRGTVHKHKERILNSKYVLRAGSRPIETGRGQEERPTYVLALPASM